MHRRDVHVGRAERLADPADHPRPVAVVGDEHHLGRLDVEPVVVEAGEPGLAGGDGPGDGVDRPPTALAGQAQLRGEPPASGVLRSTTVIPRALARAAALTRLTRWVVDVSIMPRRTAAVSGDASNEASSPAISSVTVRTPPRANWAKNRPSSSASGRYGARARAVSGVRSGALTA